MTGFDRRRGNDRGSVTVFTALAGFALLLITGLVVDGARTLRASARADQVAAEAARAAAQAADTRGPDIRIDQPAATRAVRAYLDAAGVEGQVRITGARTVEVSTIVHGRYVILAVLGSPGYTRTGTAQVTLSVGVPPP